MHVWVLQGGSVQGGSFKRYDGGNGTSHQRVPPCVCCCRFDEFGRRKRSKNEDDKRAREQAALQRLYGGTNLAPSEMVRTGGVPVCGGRGRDISQKRLGLVHAASAAASASCAVVDESEGTMSYGAQGVLHCVVHSPLWLLQCRRLHPLHTTQNSKTTSTYTHSGCCCCCCGGGYVRLCRSVLVGRLVRRVAVGVTVTATAARAVVGVVGAVSGSAALYVTGAMVVVVTGEGGTGTGIGGTTGVAGGDATEAGGRRGTLGPAEAAAGAAVVGGWSYA